ncbi:3'-5' exonuclease [Roseomonas elaeocarpi]|uniref:Transcriptional regulator n=1 Tax=Roseomonas elaeocarpi TaxID=907779 RepID=A0ABV6JRP5_9PROT
MARVFLDFEASSLERHGVPIEVGWSFENGEGPDENHLIHPAPGWDDWSAEAEAVHGIPRARLLSEGEPHGAVANRLLEALRGHDILASAPSWDGHWLSLLLRAAGLPRHALRLRDTEEAQAEAAAALLRDGGFTPGEVAERLPAVLAAEREVPLGPPAHRALEDALREREVFRRILARAAAEVAGRGEAAGDRRGAGAA